MLGSTFGYPVMSVTIFVAEAPPTTTGITATTGPLDDPGEATDGVDGSNTTSDAGSNASNAIGLSDLTLALVGALAVFTLGCMAFGLMYIRNRGSKKTNDTWLNDVASAYTKKPQQQQQQHPSHVLPGGQDGGGWSKVTEGEDWMNVTQSLHQTMQGVPQASNSQELARRGPGVLGDTFFGDGSVSAAGYGYVDTHPNPLNNRNSITSHDSWNAVGQLLDREIERNGAGGGGVTSVSVHPNAGANSPRSPTSGLSSPSNESLGANRDQNMFASGRGQGRDLATAWGDGEHDHAAYLSTFPGGGAKSPTDGYMSVRPPEDDSAVQIDQLLAMRDACDTKQVDNRGGAPLTMASMQQQKQLIDKKIEDLRAFDGQQRANSAAPPGGGAPPQSYTAGGAGSQILPRATETPNHFMPRGGGGGGGLGAETPNHFYPGGSSLLVGDTDGYLSFPGN